MKDAKEYLTKFPLCKAQEYGQQQVLEMIDKARKDLLLELATKLKTHKTGNSGSWMDASICRTPIIEMIEQLNGVHATATFEGQPSDKQKESLGKLIELAGNELYKLHKL